MDNITNPFILLGLYPLVVAVPTLMLLGQVSGWHALASRYQLRALPPVERRWFISGMIGHISYRSTLVVGVCTRGLYLAQIPICRPGHPPLCIPWSAVHHVHCPTASLMTVTVAATQDITITLPASVLQPASAYLPTPQMERPLRGPWWGVVILFTGLGVLSIVWIWFVLFRNMFG